MFDKWRKYSYAAQKDQRHRIRWVLLWFLAVLIFYVVLTTLVISARRLENDTMQPGLRRGERFIFSSHAIYRLLPDSAGANRLRRGNIVLVDTAPRYHKGIINGLPDTALRFFSAQQLSFGDRAEHYYIKRVIGLPGDEITMTNFVVRIQAKGDSFNLTEFERSERPYDVTIPHVPALWDESLPFSGSMERIVLGDDECFVLSDDRSNTNDSRTWGPVPLDLVAGQALFRYWPVNRVGLP